MKKLALILAILLVPSVVFAQTATWAISSTGENWTCISCDILADGSGNVSSPTVTNGLPSNFFTKECYLIGRAGFVPDSGDTAPDAAYDITLLDGTVAVDVLGGLGANLSQTVSTIDFPVTAANGGPQYLFGLPTVAGMEQVTGR